MARYCGRPSFSSARLDRLSNALVAYRLRKPLQDGRTCLYLTPQELPAKLAALIPPPRQHRVRYYGVLAPHAKLRDAVIATADPGEALAMQLREASARMEPAAEQDPPIPEPSPVTRRERYTWAMLLSRIYDCLPLVCSNCGHAMKIVAFVTEGETVRRILAHVGEPVDPPALSPSRAPPQGSSIGMGIRVSKRTSISGRSSRESPGRGRVAAVVGGGARPGRRERRRAEGARWLEGARSAERDFDFPIRSNFPEAVYLLAGLSAERTPRERMHGTSKHDVPELADFAATLTESAPITMLWFDDEPPHGKRGNYHSLPAIEAAVRLEEVARAADGAIYRVYPRR